MRRIGVLPVLACALVLAPTATAATRSQAYSAPGEHAFVVPAAVTSVDVTLVGANGGSGTGNSGGTGATFGATLAVTPGQTLFAEVGGNGTDAVTGQGGGEGGLGGGGNGGSAIFLFAGAPSAGGGGGASDVRTCSAGCASGTSLASRLAVAGGGGGGGGDGSDAKASGTILGGVGGVGGGPGGPGGPDAHGDLGGKPGQQGNQASGGGPGVPSVESPATAGELGRGGDGGTAPAGGGGGGGGGLYGGGGAGSGMTTEVDPNKFIVATAGGGGGGGGSSGVPAGATGVSSGGTQQTQPGGASVTFKWAAPAPAVSTSAAAIDNGAAVLHGTVNPNDTSITDCHFEIAPGADVPCAQQVGGGSSTVAVSANAHGLKSGTTYRYRLVATSAGGTSAGGQVDFTTAPGGANPGLSLTGFKLTPSRFRAAPRKGTTFAFSVSQPSRVTITFERANKGGRYVKVPGKLSVKAAGGKRKLRFLGKVGGRRLTPGAYRISAVASASAHASPVRRAKATVLR